MHYFDDQVNSESHVCRSLEELAIRQFTQEDPLLVHDRLMNKVLGTFPLVFLLYFVASSVGSNFYEILLVRSYVACEQALSGVGAR